MKPDRYREMTFCSSNLPNFLPLQLCNSVHIPLALLLYRHNLLAPQRISFYACLTWIRQVQEPLPWYYQTKFVHPFDLAHLAILEKLVQLIANLLVNVYSMVFRFILKEVWIRFLSFRGLFAFRNREKHNFRPRYFFCFLS